MHTIEALENTFVWVILVFQISNTEVNYDLAMERSIYGGPDVFQGQC